MGYDLECDMIKSKEMQLDMLTTPYVLILNKPKNGEAGADILVAHMGLTTKGTIGCQNSI